MNIVRAVGGRATCDRGRTGCVIVKDKHIISTGYVGAPAGCKSCDEVDHELNTVIQEDGTQTKHCVRTTHNEQNALVQAARFGVSTDGGTLYCMMTPCYTCAKLLINAGIKRVVAEKDYHAGTRSKAIFAEAGVQYELLNAEVVSYSNMK